MTGRNTLEHGREEETEHDATGEQTEKAIASFKDPAERGMNAATGERISGMGWYKKWDRSLGENTQGELNHTEDDILVAIHVANDICREKNLEVIQAGWQNIKVETDEDPRTQETANFMEKHGDKWYDHQSSISNRHEIASDWAEHLMVEGLLNDNPDQVATAFRILNAATDAATQEFQAKELTDDAKLTLEMLEYIDVEHRNPELMNEGRPQEVLDGINAFANRYADASQAMQTETVAFMAERVLARDMQNASIDIWEQLQNDNYSVRELGQTMDDVSTGVLHRGECIFREEALEGIIEDDLQKVENAYREMRKIQAAMLAVSYTSYGDRNITTGDEIWNQTTEAILTDLKESGAGAGEVLEMVNGMLGRMEKRDHDGDGIVWLEGVIQDMATDHLSQVKETLEAMQADGLEHDVATELEGWYHFEKGPALAFLGRNETMQKVLDSMTEDA